MAKQNSSTGSESHTFDKSLQRNVSNFYEPKNTWSFARNAINNSVTGDLGELGNEPANKLCGLAPYTIIGVIHLFADSWVIMSTDNTNCEIGLFEQEQCTYRKIVNDPCLSFDKANLITGTSKKNANCTWQIYWQDALNPDRTMCIGNADDWPTVILPDWPCVPFNCIQTTPSEEHGDVCEICTPDPLLGLNCDAIRLARLVNTACIRVTKGQTGGELPNGSYYVVMAYTLNGLALTDYSTPSNIQPLFAHDNVSTSLDIHIDYIDNIHFTQFELILVSIVNQQTTATRLGLYSTETQIISIDKVHGDLEKIPFANTYLRQPIVDKSDLMVDNGTYLMRVGPYNKFDFNYQPIANLITTKWQSMEYAGSYYNKGGYQAGYMRDEVYCFFIRWVYNTGDKSSSYHIPGRPSQSFTTPTGLFYQNETDVFTAVNCFDNIEYAQTGINPQVFEVYNTGTFNQILIDPLTGLPPRTPDGAGYILSEGQMGYWESEEVYPNNPVMWNSNNSNTPWDLCGAKIRHHKFPDNSCHPTTYHFTNVSPYFPNEPAIRLMGVIFENISVPVDNANVPIPNIVAFEILRGSREGNRTVIAKGMVNNLGQYDLNIDGDANISTPLGSRVGLYPNYPYNDIGLDPQSMGDPYLCTTQSSQNGLNGGVSFEFNGNNINTFPKTVLTFHSPDTQFRNPFLSVKELKVYGELQSKKFGKRSVGVVQKFEIPEKHPKFKQITNLAFIISMVSGVGLGLSKAIGNRTTTNVGVGVLTGNPVSGTAATTYLAIQAAANLITFGGAGIVQLIGNLNPLAAYTAAMGIAQLGGVQVPGTTGGTTTTTVTDSPYSSTPSFLPQPAGAGFNTAIFYFQQGTDEILNFLLAMLPYEQYALTCRSHAFYNNWEPRPNPTSLCLTRRVIRDSMYLDAHIQNFTDKYVVNNLFRQKTVILDINEEIYNTILPDNSKQTVGTAINHSPRLLPFDWNIKSVTGNTFTTNAASLYVGLKQRLRNQYGQIDAVKQEPTSSCVVPINSLQTIYKSTSLLGGDSYVTRYTEKNTMPFFYDFLYGQLDGTEFNYNLKKNVLYPVFWLNSEKFDAYDFFDSVQQQLATFQFSLQALVFPSTYRVLDKSGADFSFNVKNSYFYLFNSGVRDFFVESEINTELRDWEDDDTKRHYDPIRYTDLNRLFDVGIIKSGNYYKYDFSLSISKIYPFQIISYGNTQPLDYDPEDYQKCYAYRPNTIIYSLPVYEKESIADYWRVFLYNNHKNYTSRPTSVKTIGTSGIVIFFEYESPIQYQGVDTLLTDDNMKITIGDGGLFSQPKQSVNNVDASYEYASCQNYRGAVNTPAGLYWISANQGKIFQLAQGASELSSQDLKWWFVTYLPFQLLQAFPDFKLIDNPVIGIGCQSIYNNMDGLIYFCKRDYKLKADSLWPVTYSGVSNIFIVTISGVPIRIALGDPEYFEDASWTISYDPKSKAWLSWHDWHPELSLGNRNTFITTKTNLNKEGGLWVHNYRSDLYCNYYGIDYPFELEFRVHSGQNVQTLKSIEYIMEVYKYSANETDRFHILDFNFDYAVIYNTEQVSGLLQLELSPKNNAPLTTTYPIIGFNNIRILYSKVENKYRFDQFWDITDNRGEYSNAQRTIWLTSANGYNKVLNTVNLNYQKLPFQRKKFRHYMVTVLLKRAVCSDKKMLVMIQNIKSQYSPR
jgi:hypothetical protein